MPVKFLVVIVSWKVCEKLRICLQALQLERDHRTDIEVVVVDNASNDGSMGMVLAEFPWVKLIVNDDNKGFAVACNQGARVVDSNWLVFLNPDAAVKSGFFDELQQFVNIHNKAEVIGGRIFNEDGSVQASVRRNPNIWILFLDLIKIKNLLPWLANSYLRREFDYTKPALVDQVKGACMVVARELWNYLGGFDAKFFVWFEEVDFCKRAQKNGTKVWYAPEVAVTHNGAASFNQLSYVHKHQLFTNSALTYVNKHHSVLAYAFLWIVSRPWFVMAWVLDFGCKPVGRLVGIFLGLGLIEWLSYVAFFVPWLGNVCVVVLVIMWFIVAIKNLTAGVWLLIIELILGSLGYWFSLAYDSEQLSLRMALFAAAIGVMVWHLTTGKRWRLWDSNIKYWYALALSAIVWGYVVGFWRGNDWGSLFLDMNGYFYLLLFPLFYEVGPELLQARWLKWLGVVMIWQAVKTIILVFYFTHLPAPMLVGYNDLPIYHWLRDTGWGQVARLSERGFRVFSQAHVYAALIWIGIATYFISIRDQFLCSLKNQKFIYLVWLATTITVVLSGSRSFWLGLIMVVFSGTLILIARGKWEALRLQLMRFLVISVITTIVVLLVGGWNSQNKLINTKNIPQSFSTRASAVSSRWQLLKPLWDGIAKHIFIGSGWGATITYKTQDPQVMARTAGSNGIYTTSAFEWGYLDLWYKLGLLGAIAYIFFFFIAIVPGFLLFRQITRSIMSVAAVVMVVVLFIIHITTPYINHPLGLGVAMLAIGYLSSYKLINRV